MIIVKSVVVCSTTHMKYPNKDGTFMCMKNFREIIVKGCNDMITRQVY